MNQKRLQLSINKTANECMPIFEHIDQNIKPFKMNVKLCILDGMDCCGKETVSKMLKSRFEKDYPDDIVRLLSFPDYNVSSGVIIKDMLTKGFEDLDDVRTFQSQMFLNRFDVIKKLQEEVDIEENKNKTLYLILDRFFMSHFAYNSMMETDDQLLTEFNPLYRILVEETNIYSRWFDLNGSNHNANGTCILFYYNYKDFDKSKAIHMAKLEEKAGKDSYETSEKQDAVSHIYAIPGLAEMFYRTHVMVLHPENTIGISMEDLENNVNAMQVFF